MIKWSLNIVVTNLMELFASNLSKPNPPEKEFVKRELAKRRILTQLLLSNLIEADADMVNQLKNFGLVD